MVWNSVDLTSKLSTKMRLRTTRTVVAPTQQTVLDGTTQYWSKTAPNKLTFTNNFTVTATTEISAHPTTSNRYIGGRADATAANGFGIGIDTSGRPFLFGSNAGAGNTRIATATQSVPLNREVKLAFTWATGTILCYMDGALVPSTTATAGTAPTVIVQGGDLAVGRLGSVAAGTFFPGKVSQFAIYDAVLSAATILSLASQGLVGNEANLKSGYSFNNVATDLNTTTPNDLTGTASPTYSVGGGFGNKGVSSTFDYGIVMAEPTFSTNTTAIVQVPEGCTIPTSGGVSAVDYSAQDAPYRFPSSPEKWRIEFTLNTIVGGAVSATTYYNQGNIQLAVPAGVGKLGVRGQMYLYNSAGGGIDQTKFFIGTTSAASAVYDPRLSIAAYLKGTNAGTELFAPVIMEAPVTLSAMTVLYLNEYANSALTTVTWHNGTGGVGSSQAVTMYWENAYL